MQIFTPKPVTGRSDVFMYVLVTSCHELSGIYLNAMGALFASAIKTSFFKRFFV